MEKVKLTREQAEAIENTVSRYGNDLTVIRHAERYFNDGDWRILNVLTTAKVAKALYIGYEVEPEFKVGDWVYVKGIFKSVSPEIAKVTDVKTHRMILDNGFDLGKGSITLDTVRHATPEEIAKEKQRRWWAKHGREVWEVRALDIVENKSSGDLLSVSESYVNEFKNEAVQDNYEVVCFAEDRKDVQA